jgi:hypothetical protein
MIKNQRRNKRNTRFPPTSSLNIAAQITWWQNWLLLSAHWQMLLDCVCFTDNNYTHCFKYHSLHITVHLQCENVCPVTDQSLCSTLCAYSGSHNRTVIISVSLATIKKTDLETNRAFIQETIIHNSEQNKSNFNKNPCVITDSIIIFCIHFHFLLVWVSHRNFY